MTTLDPRHNSDQARTGRVFLIRHGRTALNADGRLRGRLDPPLDGIGEREVAALAAQLAEHRLVLILSSPLTRAMQTARAIGDATWLPVTALSGLLDRDYGRWAGTREREVVRLFGRVDDAPGVEPLTSVTSRARDVLERQRMMLARGDIVLVSHDAVNKALISELDPDLADGLRQRTACWNEIRLVEDHWTIAQVDQKPTMEGLDVEGAEQVRTP